VSAVPKLFVAAALVGTGLGVAFLLGRPVSQKPSPLASSGSVAVRSTENATHADRWHVGNWLNEGARLLPDTTSSPIAKPVAAPLAGMSDQPLQLPATPSPLASNESVSASYTVAGAPPLVDIGPIGLSLAAGDSGVTAGGNPQVNAPPGYQAGMNGAHLRLEPPKPVGNEPRSPATIRRVPNVAFEKDVIDGTADPYKVSGSAPAPPLQPMSYTASGPTFATPASYETPRAASDPVFAPPSLWSSRGEEREEARTHVVRDGDSLEKLASLYLNDPRRGSEIYELNRDVLSRPDMLPIGVTLKLPSATSNAPWGKQTRRLPSVDSRPIGETASRNATPVRCPPVMDEIVPSAQLGRPLAAD
jgi:hypothetical protein